MFVLLILLLFGAACSPLPQRATVPPAAVIERSPCAGSAPAEHASAKPRAETARRLERAHRRTRLAAAFRSFVESVHPTPLPRGDHAARGPSPFAPLFHLSPEVLLATLPAETRQALRRLLL